MGEESRWNRDDEAIWRAERSATPDCHGPPYVTPGNYSPA